MVLESCVATSPVKNEVKGSAQIIDWQGSELGRAVLEWVFAVNDSDKVALSKLPEMEGKVSFFVTGTGKDRDLLQVWVDTNDAAAKLFKLIQENVTATAETGTRGNKDEEKDVAKKMAQSIMTVFSNTQFSRVIKERDFWTQVRRPNGETVYCYYVLYSIVREKPCATDRHCARKNFCRKRKRAGTSQRYGRAGKNYRDECTWSNAGG